MTVSSTSVSSGPYVPNGVTTTFAVSHYTVSSTEIEVLIDGEVVSSLLYTFDRDDDGTGEVTFAVAPTGDELVIYSKPSFLQPTEFQRFAPLFPDQVNIPLDAAAGRDLWLRDKVNRAVVAPRGETLGELPAAASRLGKVFGFNASTGAIALYTVDDFQGEKGDPGSNVMSIGLFADAGGLTIAVGADLVHTSGHTQVGKGAARYAYDASVIADSATTFVSANGRGFRLAEVYRTPAMFGALGENADDTLALNTMALDMRNNAERDYFYDFRVGGHFEVTDTLYIGMPLLDGDQIRAICMGGCIRVRPPAQLPNGEPLEVVVDIAGPRQMHLGRWEVYPTGTTEYGQLYSERHFFTAFRIRSAASSTFGDFYADSGFNNLVAVDSLESGGFTFAEGTDYELAYPNANNIGITMGAIYGRYFGSAQQSAAFAYQTPLLSIEEGSWDQVSNPETFTPGVSDGVHQRSRLTVASTARFRQYDLVRARHVLGTGGDSVGTFAFDNATSKITVSVGGLFTGAEVRAGNRYIPQSGLNANTVFEVIAVTDTQLTVYPAPVTEAAAANTLVSDWHYRTIREVYSATQIGVFPSMPSSVNSQLQLVAGACLYSAGGDNASLSVRSVRGLMCGIGLHNASLYAPTVGHILIDYGTVGIRMGGLAQNQSSLDLEISSGHLEAAEVSILYESSNVAGVVSAGVDVPSIRNIASPITDRLALTPRAVGVPNVIIRNPTFTLQPRAQYWREGLDYNNASLSNMPGQNERMIHATSPTVTLDFEDAVLDGYGEHHVAAIRTWTNASGTVSAGTLTVNLHPRWIARGFTFVGGGTTYTLAAPAKIPRIDFYHLSGSSVVAPVVTLAA